MADLDYEAAMRPITQCSTCKRPCNRIAIMPRWEHDKTVIANGWVEGRCPECGHSEEKLS
jgi:hypothetical protein